MTGLRNELLFGDSCFLLNGLQGGEGLMESAFVGGLVAEQDGESGWKLTRFGCGEGLAL